MKELIAAIANMIISHSIIRVEGVSPVSYTYLEPILNAVIFTYILTSAVVAAFNIAECWGSNKKHIMVNLGTNILYMIITYIIFVSFYIFFLLICGEISLFISWLALIIHNIAGLIGAIVLLSNKDYDIPSIFSFKHIPRWICTRYDEHLNLVEKYNQFKNKNIDII